MLSKVLINPDVVIHQKTLYNQLRYIFPNHTIQENTRKQSDLKYPATSGFVEFDVWIPSLNVCFEFQDNYHYETTWYYQRPLTYVQTKDDAKKDLVNQAGFSLVIVPCWWSGDRESLEATICFHRPDLLDNSNTFPISLNPTTGFFKPTDIPEVRELMLASFPRDPNNFHLSLERNAWWLGEKYDGVRCCWNSRQKQLYTRHGRKLQLLQNISYPSVFVDGELWFGRGQFSLAYTLQLPDVRAWQFLRLISFDIPAVIFNRKPFEERYSTLLSSISYTDPFTIIAMRVSCESSSQMEIILDFIICDGGEGLIFRKKRSFYEQGRSPFLVKLKSVQRDKEAVVVDKLADNSVVLKLPDGNKFTVPPQNVHMSKIAPGDVVTISYEIHARRDAPVSPNIERIRTDISWEDVVLNYRKENKYLNDNSHIRGFYSKPISPQVVKHMRLFLEDFAKNKGLDPLLPETWYKIPFKSFKNIQGGKTILRKFKGEGRYFKMLRTLFPDIGLQKSTFYRRYSRDINNIRHYLETYATKKGFDPKKLENWIAHNKKNLTTEPGRPIVGNIKGGYYKTLELVFPELGFDNFHKNSWQNAGNRRKFFEAFAKDNQFDPLNAENWYSVSREHVLSYKGANRILVYHKHSLSRALLDLFPNIGLDESRLPQLHLWGNAAKRRNFFETYAEENNFDPLVPENWYSQPRGKILSFKGATGVVPYHNNQVSQALLDLFPDIGLEVAKLRPWQDSGTRRNFFEEYAKQNNFDPLHPVNWYQQPAYKIFKLKYAKRVLSHYGNSVKLALLDLFPEIGLEDSRFDFSTWDESEKGKLFFENYAKLRGFDPLVPTNWYRQLLSEILALKGSRKVREKYGNNIAKALLKLYPSIGLQKSKLRHLETSRREGKRRMWSDEKQRRKFFEEYALVRSFDPLVPEKWYEQTREQITSVRGSGAVLYYYNYSITQALCSLFPDIGLDPSKFSPSMMKKQHSVKM